MGCDRSSDASERDPDLEPMRAVASFLVGRPDAPDCRPTGIAQVCRQKPLCDHPTGSVVWPHAREIGVRSPVDRPIDLATGRFVFVGKQYGDAVGRRFNGCREAGRPRANYDQVVGRCEISGRVNVPDHASCPTTAAPSCVSTRMPSSTVIRQACRFARSSILTRHSKHTPIMQ